MVEDVVVVDRSAGGPGAAVSASGWRTPRGRRCHHCRSSRLSPAGVLHGAETAWSEEHDPSQVTGPPPVTPVRKPRLVRCRGYMNAVCRVGDRWSVRHHDDNT